MLKIRKELNLRTFFLIIPIIFLGISLSFLILDRSQSYLYYERIEFNCADTKIHANLYHPTKNLDFQDKHPLVIYVHGFSTQKDFDLRVPIELTKRGFYVACVDMLGHGESANSHLLAVDADGKLEMTQVCSKLLDKIEKLGCYTQIDDDQIGLVGHSLGGYVVLMNGLYDERFKVTISWAGVTDVVRVFKGADIDKNQKELLHDNNPEEVMNNDTKQPKNLLLIIHKEGSFYKDNKKLHDITKCNMEKFTYPVINEGEAHLLLHGETMIKTILWLENVFFDSKTINGQIQLSYGSNYLLIFLTFISIYLTTFSLMIYSSKYILNREGLNYIKRSNKKDPSSELEKSLILSKKTQILIFSLSIIIFISIWILSSMLLGMLALIIAPLLIIVIYGLFFRKIILRDKTERKEKLSFKDQIKSETTVKSLRYAACCAGIYLGLYFAFALFYPFFLYYPLSFLAFALAIIIFPLYLSTEIFYRKIIFPSLEFIKSRKTRTYIITIITVFTQIFLMTQILPFLAWPFLIVTTIALMISSIMNGIIYHKTEKLGAVLLNSFIILGIFYGATMSFIINLIAIIS
jgi:hypothetical protein